MSGPGDAPAWRSLGVIRAIVLGAGLALGAPMALCAPVSVTPTSVTMSASKTSDLVSLTNQGDTPVRFQLTVSTWDQRPDGEMVLNPTEEVLLFPPLIQLAPRETKRVRLGIAGGGPPVEKSYRLTIQELPPQQPNSGEVQIQMLTKLSLPVFVQPSGGRPDPRIEGLALAGGILSFALTDGGNQHVLFRRIRLAGQDGAGQQSFEAATTGWYVLPGGRRDYRVELAAGDCRKSLRLILEAETEEKTVQAALPVTPGACGSAAATRYLEANAGPGRSGTR
jgi:fimbrial chaperone protein